MRALIIAVLLALSMLPWATATADAATPAVAEIQVLSLEYYPLTPDGQDIDISVTGDVGGPAQQVRDKVAAINANLIEFLSEGSRFRGHSDAAAQPSLTYRIVDTIRRDVAVPSVPLEFDNPPYTVRADYMGIMRSIDICDRVAAGLDEVWLWAYQGPSQLAISESNMAGPYGDISNSWRLADLPVCDSTYVVYTYNYGRGTAEAVHSYSHQLETEFRHLDSKLFGLWWGLDSSYRPPRALGEPGRCGSVHHPPNGDADYDYWDSTPWPSDCLDWDPDGLGATANVSCATWGCVDASDRDNAHVNYLVWWMQNIPGHQNGITYRGADLRNWWRAHADFDTFSANGWVLWKPASPPTTRLVDDKAKGFTKYQRGWKKQNVGWKGRSFWTPVRRVRKFRSAVWQAELDAPGRYEVQVRFPKRNATTKAAFYKVFTKDGVITRKKNQRYHAGRWVTLGTFAFDSVAKVKLTDRTGELTSSGRRIVFDVVRFVPTSLSSATKPKVASPRPQPDRSDPTALKLRLYPKEVSAVPGARKLVSAWTCPADDRSPYGPDRTPGTRDDECTAVEADWRLQDEATARLNKRRGHKVLVQLATEADNRVIATLGDLKQGTPVSSKPRPDDKPMPPIMGDEPEPPELKLRLHPKEIGAVPGARKLVSAWTCPADDRSPFGPDRDPGTRDDECTAVEADWRLQDEATARLNKRHGHKVLVQLATEADNRVIAILDDLKQGTPVNWKPRPEGKPMPDLMKPFAAAEPAAE